MRNKNFFLLFLVLAFSIKGITQPTYFIDDEFPGGNINIEKITEDTAYLLPDYRDTEGYWFYWNFRVKRAENKTITFCFNANNTYATYSPAISKNNGKDWEWMPGTRGQGRCFTYSFGAHDTIVQFSMSFPYTQENLYDFLGQHQGDMIRVDTLCQTRRGRMVEQIIIKKPGLVPTHKVLITARHHACESTASFVVEGIMEAIIADEQLDWLRGNVAFMVIPFVDKDGVERGDQGKNRSPRDHNRDYAGHSIYNTTATIRQEIPGWAGDKLKMSLDIHSPWIKGDYNEYIYLVGSRNKKNEAEQERFSMLIEKNNAGELKYSHDNFLFYGQAWNKAKSFSKGRSFKDWSTEELNIPLSTSMEVPYSQVSGTILTTGNARAFGHDVAKAIHDYLKF